MASKSKSKRRTRRRSDAYSVFVSHATADKWIATMICEKIEAAGASFFRDDYEIHSGDEIPGEIRTAIRRCKEFVVLFTPSSKDRTWVHAEMGAAWLLKRRIVAILCHTEMNSIPGMLQSQKAIALNDIANYLSELGTRVRVAKRRKGGAR